MKISEQELEIPASPNHVGIISHVERALGFRLSSQNVPVRFVVSSMSDNSYHCEVGELEMPPLCNFSVPNSITKFVQRKPEKIETFNTVLVVPTGIGAEIGGHAGDAMPVAKLLGQLSDTLITHPNVVNASDINEAPDNALYVEGSVISRLMMGTIGLQRVRNNRVLVVLDAHEDELFIAAATNSVSAARASYGLDCPKVIKLDPPVKMTATYSNTGRAVGVVEDLEHLFSVLENNRDQFDAVALSSVIRLPPAFRHEYFDQRGDVVNPWGGVEAMLTHAVSSIFDVPSAHAPMFENREIANMEMGIVDPRMAAEVVSMTFLQCVLKGLQKSPRIITNEQDLSDPAVLSASDISCLVIPDGCVGLPTLAALEQGIAVIAVRENKNLMKNDLTALPWADGQLTIVENYWEASGVIAAMRAGIQPSSVRRPLVDTKVELVESADPRTEKTENTNTAEQA